jgi:hypothetical protein
LLVVAAALGWVIWPAPPRPGGGGGGGEPPRVATAAEHAVLASPPSESTAAAPGSPREPPAGPAASPSSAGRPRAPAPGAGLAALTREWPRRRPAPGEDSLRTALTIAGRDGPVDRGALVKALARFASTIERDLLLSLERSGALAQTVATTLESLARGKVPPAARDVDGTVRRLAAMDAAVPAGLRSFEPRRKGSDPRSYLELLTYLALLYPGFQDEIGETMAQVVERWGPRAEPLAAGGRGPLARIMTSAYGAAMQNQWAQISEFIESGSTPDSRLRKRSRSPSPPRPPSPSRHTAGR